MGVLISIKPKWCELIASGKKTVEVRKSVPKLKPPFTVYIYETQGKTDTPFVDEEGHAIYKGRGEVIGEFICDGVEVIDMIYSENLRQANSKINTILSKSCLSCYDLLCYLGRDVGYKNGYAWHISDLVIYDKPKMLSDFKVMREYGTWTVVEKLKRAPLSWCYVVSTEGGDRR